MFQQSRIMKTADVLAVTRLSRPTLYRMLQREEFPPPFRLNNRDNAWMTDEIDEWIRARSEKRKVA